MVAITPADMPELSLEEYSRTIWWLRAFAEGTVKTVSVHSDLPDVFKRLSDSLAESRHISAEWSQKYGDTLDSVMEAAADQRLAPELYEPSIRRAKSYIALLATALTQANI